MSGERGAAVIGRGFTLSGRGLASIEHLNFLFTLSNAISFLTLRYFHDEQDRPAESDPERHSRREIEVRAGTARETAGPAGNHQGGAGGRERRGE